MYCDCGPGLNRPGTGKVGFKAGCSVGSGYVCDGIPKASRQSKASLEPSAVEALSCHCLQLDIRYTNMSEVRLAYSSGNDPAWSIPSDIEVVTCAFRILS
jgi:hypothetical protein